MPAVQRNPRTVARQRAGARNGTGAPEASGAYGGGGRRRSRGRFRAGHVEWLGPAGGSGRPAARDGAQAARRIGGMRIGREPGPPTCEKGCIRQSSP
ncbi:hypothetical protein GCM10020256_65570 [Streptomyces thermocoprophilus]